MSVIIARRAGVTDAGSLPWIQRDPLCADRRPRRGAAHRPGRGRPGLYRPVYGKMVGFVKLYFPVFLLGAVFGKLIELSGFSRSIVAAAIRILAPPRDPGDRAGVRPADLRRVSLFVVAFAVYPFAAELFRQSGSPNG